MLKSLYGVLKVLTNLNFEIQNNKKKCKTIHFQGVYCNGKAVGYLRRADFGHSINKSIGRAYIRFIDDRKPFDVTDIEKQTFEIDVLGQMYPAEVHLNSPLQKTMM